MRNAETRVTLGVTAAREGDLEQALLTGERALEGDRQSVPSLIMTSRELAARCDADTAPNLQRRTISDGFTHSLNKSLASYLGKPSEGCKGNVTTYENHTSSADENSPLVALRKFA